MQTGFSLATEWCGREQIRRMNQKVTMQRRNYLTTGIYQLAAQVCVLLFFATPQGLAQEGTGNLKLVDQFSNAVQELAERVSPSVVKIEVTRYGPERQTNRASAVIGKQENVGSGVIVDPNGYIITNAHVVESAQEIKVSIVPRGAQTVQTVLAQNLATPKDATLVGMFRAADLALLKVDSTGLPALPFADYSSLRQGQVVFAFGSPQGLENSMSMGVISSIARQPDPDSPMLYIQTDAPINPGNSGGPLVNTSGQVVGLDTFIVSEAGGSEGIGFAIPSIMVKWVFEQLKQYGHVHRPVIGVGLQTITPTLADALRLPRRSGVLVSDVLPGGPAEAAGLKINDILLAVDNIQLDNVAALMAVTFEHGSTETLSVQVLRGEEMMNFKIKPVDAPHAIDRLADLASPSTNRIPQLGILGVTVNQTTADIAGKLRRPSGVLVAARLATLAGAVTGLEAGDVIHEINGNFVLSVEALRAAAAKLKKDAPVALLIEREGKLSYLAFNMQ